MNFGSAIGIESPVIGNRLASELNRLASAGDRLVSAWNRLAARRKRICSRLQPPARRADNLATLYILEAIDDELAQQHQPEG